MPFHQVDFSDPEDLEIVTTALQEELAHALKIFRECSPRDAGYWLGRVNRLTGLLTQIDGRMRPKFALSDR